MRPGLKIRRLPRSLQQTKENLSSELSNVRYRGWLGREAGQKAGTESPHSENKTSPPATVPLLILGDQIPENEQNKIQIHKDREKGEETTADMICQPIL